MYLENSALGYEHYLVTYQLIILMTAIYIFFACIEKREIYFYTLQIQNFST